MQLDACYRWARVVAYGRIIDEEPNGEYSVVEDAVQEAMLRLVNEGWIQYGEGRDSDLDNKQKDIMHKAIYNFFDRHRERNRKGSMWQNSADEQFGSILWGTPDPNMTE